MKIANSQSPAEIIRSAARAGWQMLAVSWSLLILNWSIYLYVMKQRPEWFLSVWGVGADWVLVQDIWLRASVYLKIGAWLQALLVIWLSFWARELRHLA